MLDFEKEVRVKREENLYLLKESLYSLSSNSDLMQKIELYADRYGLVKEYVCDKLLFWDEDMLLNGFEKDPWRQNIYEILQLEFIQKMARETALIKEVKKLSSSGKDARYIKNWEIVNLGKVDRWELKSLDFYWYYSFCDEMLEFYTTCKYTQDEWWAQDNQANDVYLTYQEAKKIVDSDIYFIALVDWAYYHRLKWEGRDFFDYLNQQSDWKNCVCLDSSSLFEHIKCRILRRLSSKDFDQSLVEIEKEKILSVSWSG